MDLELTSRQQDLVEQVRNLVSGHRGAMTPDRSDDVPDYDANLWSDLLAARIVNVGFPAHVGGGGGGLTDMTVVVEELGRGPVPTPILDGIGTSGSALLAAGADEDLVEEVLTGRRRVASTIGTTKDNDRVVATRSQGHWSLSGTAHFVPYALDVDDLLVVAESPKTADDGTMSLFLVGVDSAGLSLDTLQTISRDELGRVQFDGVQLGRAALIGNEGQATQWLPSVTAVGRVLVAAEMVGAAAAALDHARHWAITRVQFGTTVASFQAVQHRMADGLIALVTARDAAYDAAGTIDRGEPGELAAVAAKAYCIEACRRITATAHQVCGGEGIYADQPLHLWHRRVAALSGRFGTSLSNRAEVAAALFES